MPTPLSIRFDRGTLSVTGDCDPTLLRTLPGVVWDPRVQVFRAPAYVYSALISALQNQGIPFQDEVKYGWGFSHKEFSLPLRPYQQAALSSWQSVGSRGIVVLPTGAGKTIVAVAAIAKLRLPAICLVPTRLLLEQWRDRLREHLKVPIGIIGDGNYELAPITVTTFESAFRYMNRIGNRFPLLIVDEAHHFGTAMRDEALEMCIAPYRLGLTATPVTASEASKKLVQILGRTVYEVTISELVGQYLAPFRHVTMQVDLYPDERTAYDRDIGDFRSEFSRFRQSSPEGSWAEFASWASREDSGRKALVAWRRLGRLIAFCRAKEEALSTLMARHRDNRVLIFTADTQAAYQISKKLLIAPITSDIKKKEREDTLDKFRRGTLRALVSCRVLNEGVDVPEADVAIIIAGKQGEREHIQRVGRCLRPSPGKEAIIYELVAKNTIEVKQWLRRTESLAFGNSAQVQY